MGVKQLLEIVVCPVCKGKLEYRPAQNELVCLADRLAFPIRDGIPVMSEAQARALTLEETERKTGA